LLALFQSQYFSPIIKAIFLSALVSMIRILPPALQFVNGTGLQSLGGFTSVFDLLQVFIVSDNRAYWEKAYYVGVIGFAFILYFGVIKNWNKEERYRPLYLVMLAMVFFSVGSTYLPFFNSPIPFMDSQRAPTRFVIIPLVFLITFASIQLQSLINEWGQSGWEKKVGLLFAEALMAYDLIFNSRIWSLVNYGISKRATDIIEVSVANYPDPPYLETLIIGFAITTITLIVLILLAVREKKESV
jgi:hypothetical protein